MTAVPPTWTILVPTLGERASLFRRLLSGLLPQVEGWSGSVRVVGWFNNGRPTLPEIRQRLIETTTTDYVSFVDDDDLVAPYFVDEVMTALEHRPDYVGFQVQCYSDARPTAVSHHSLKYREWRNYSDHYVRDISHINPMRTSIARTADFRRARARRAEDRAWVEQLRRGGRLQHEVFVPRIMYHYLYSTSRETGLGSRWQIPHLIAAPAGGRPVVDSPHFSWSPDGD